MPHGKMIEMKVVYCADEKLVNAEELFDEEHWNHGIEGMTINITTITTTRNVKVRFQLRLKLSRIANFHFIN